MKKRSLQDWAAIAEILGTVGVVISLVFVAYTVNRNTLELRLVNENVLWQLNDDIISGLLGSSDILSIVDKRDKGEELTRVEEWAMYVFTTRQFNAWEMAFYRFQDGAFSPERWEAVNEGLSSGLIEGFSSCDEECWENFRVGYGADFVRHVDEVYSHHH
ncbi:MAG: hypothetical protein OEM63_01470 [Gammaproteobacteria bacterium]|nr:hypothetical protein [Gammaproteobacteria bacterium]